MLTEAHARIQPALQKRDYGFRWRGHEISRIEGLSDAVFAFCVTLLVVSLEAPKTFAELSHMMRGFVSFAICFVLLLAIWHTQYIYFRRYALDDTVSFLLNGALLFVVAFYIYPLKFLMTVLTNAWMRYEEVDASGHALHVVHGAAEWRPLMMIYNAGFIALYGIFALLYRHAYRQRATLELTPMEEYETRGVIQENVLMMSVGVVAMIVAQGPIPQLAGLVYMLIGPLQTALGFKHARRRRELSEGSASAQM